MEVLTNFVGGDLIADEAEEELEVEVPDPASSSTSGGRWESPGGRVPELGAGALMWGVSDDA